MSGIKLLLILVIAVLIVVLFKYVQIKRQIRNLSKQMTDLTTGKSEKMLDISLVDKDIEQLAAVLNQYVHIQEAGKFIGYLGMQYLLHIAYGSVILFLVYLFQNVVASLLTGILLAAGILQVVDALLINIIPRLKEIADFSIMNYLSSGNVGLLSMASGGSLYLKALLIAIITLILMGSLSGLMMQKKDI